MHAIHIMRDEHGAQAASKRFPRPLMPLDAPPTPFDAPRGQPSLTGDEGCRSCAVFKLQARIQWRWALMEPHQSSGLGIYIPGRNASKEIESIRVRVRARARVCASLLTRAHHTSSRVRTSASTSKAFFALLLAQMSPSCACTRACARRK
jgi:hypothetical protein